MHVTCNIDTPRDALRTSKLDAPIIITSIADIHFLL